MKTSIDVLAFDFGASSGRAILGSYDCKNLQIKEIHRFSNDPVSVLGSLHWDVLRLFLETKNGIQKYSHSKTGELSSIAIDTWGVDFGFLDSRGKLLENPYHYRDNRTDEMFDEAFKIIKKEDMYKKTGIEFKWFNTIFQLLAVKINSPHILQKAKTMLLMPDLLSYFLSGEKTTEFTNASTTQMCDAISGLWAKEMLTKMDLPTEILTDIVMPGSVKGKLLPDISSELGIANIPILSAASHDTASAVASVPSAEDEFIYISSGTWSLMGAELKTPIVNDESYKFNFTNEKGANGTTRFQKNIMGLWIVQECIRQWKREGLDLDFKTIDMEIDNVEKFKSFIDPDDDLFISPGNMPKRIKDFCIKTGQQIPSNNIEIIQCVIQSLAMRYRETLEKIELLTGIKSDKIYVIGGGVKDINLCKSTASSTGKTVLAGPIEATAIGNIIVQLMGLGEIASLKEARQIISNSFSVNTYTPSEKEKWDAGYLKFKNVCKGM